MPEGQMPPEAAPAEQKPEGGGPAEALNALGQGLSDVAGAMAQDPGVPDGAKQAFASALEAFKAGMAALEGGGEGPQPEQGVSTPEQGASGAQPANMGRR